MRQDPVASPARAGAFRYLGRAAVLAAGLAVAGCVWDPYTRSYVPCCAYPYAYPYPYPYPAYAPPRSPPVPPAPRPAAASRLEDRFAAANVTGDGRLTYQQVRDAHWHVVVRNFGAIDVGHKGYVTLGDLRAWFAATGRPPQ